MANSTVDTGRNPVEAAPNPAGAVPGQPFPAPTHEREFPMHDVDTRPTFGAGKLPDPGGSEGSLGQSQPLPNLVPPSSRAGQSSTQGTHTTAGRRWSRSGRPGARLVS
jgi:hypothetical protein